METSGLIIYISILGLISLYSFFFFKRISLSYRWLALLIVASLLNELVIRFASINQNTMLMLYHILVPITLIMNIGVYFSMKSLRKIKFVILIVGIMSVVLTLINSFFYQNNQFPSHSITILCINLILFALLAFKNMIDYPASHHLIKNSLFWFSFSNLFFYTITFFSFLLFNYYANVEWINKLNYYANLLLYLGYFLAIYFEVNKIIPHE